MKTVTFEGIDSNNRPVFKGINSCLRYGNCEELFPYQTSEAEVMKKVTSESLVYFGESFGCEPMGSGCNVRIKSEGMRNLTHLHAIEVSPFTSSKGVKKLRLKSARFNQSILVPWNWNTDTMDSLKDNAIEWLEDMDFTLESFAIGKDSYVFLSSTFEPLK